MTAILNVDGLASASTILAELAKGPTGYFLAFLGIALFFVAISIAPFLAIKLANYLKGGVKRMAGGRRGRRGKRR